MKCTIKINVCHRWNETSNEPKITFPFPFHFASVNPSVDSMMWLHATMSHERNEENIEDSYEIIIEMIIIAMADCVLCMVLAASKAHKYSRYSVIRFKLNKAELIFMTAHIRPFYSYDEWAQCFKDTFQSFVYLVCNFAVKCIHNTLITSFLRPSLLLSQI